LDRVILSDQDKRLKMFIFEMFSDGEYKYAFFNPKSLYELVESLLILINAKLSDMQSFTIA
jgi:hypothetical protein